jgi:predicted phage-related endonuclease
MSLAFDTLRYTKKLRAAGVPDQQAEVQAETLAEIVEERLATKRDLKEVEVALKRDLKEVEVALKRDLKELEAALKRDIKDLEVSLKREISEIKSETIKWVAGMLIAQAALIATLVKLL